MNRDDFYPEIRVFLSGTFSKSDDKIKSCLEECNTRRHVRRVTVDNELSTRTCVMLVGEDQPNENKRQWEKLVFDGYAIPIINEDGIDQIIEDSLYFRGGSKFLPPQKDFELSYERLFVSSFSPFVQLDFRKDFHSWTEETFLMPQYESDFLTRECALKRILEQVNAKIVRRFNPEKTACCLLMEESMEKLRKGERDNTIRVIENAYNLSYKTEFKYQFINEEDLIYSLIDYAKDKKDKELAKALDSYKYNFLTKTIPDSLCHYTDMNALPNILRKSEDIEIRASNILYLNDRREVQEGLEVARSLLNDIVGKGNANRRIRSLKNILDKMDVDACHDFYVSSFCEHEDDLTMWAMYADNGRGCVLELDGSQVAQKFGVFVKCNYNKVDVYHLYKKIIGGSHGSNISTNGRGKNLLNAIIICLSTKHLGFKHEREWRGIWLKTERDGKDVKYRLKNNCNVPYIEMHVPREALKRVLIGPNTDELSEKSIKHLLKTNGYNNVKVVKSKLPYRG